MSQSSSRIAGASQEAGLRFEHTSIATNGIHLHVVMAGPTDGQPVFLLHGFPEFWYGWRRQIGPLAEAGYRVIVPDQRGYHLSDKPAGVKSYRLDALVNDALGLADALGYEKVNLVGHDWGAAVAWTFSLSHPERLRKLGILNVPHPAVMLNFLRRGDPEQLRRSWYMFAFQLPWLPEYLLRKNDWRNAVRVLRGSGKIHTFSNEDIAEYKQAWSQPGAMAAMLNWYRAMLRHRPNIPKDLRVHVPTLILWGMQDVALSHRMARLSLDYCDSGKLVFFEDATHWVQHDEAEEVNQLLMEFLG
ncbi:MAG: alpha/beta fold hydrolase [Chloroflexota bacterium]